MKRTYRTFFVRDSLETGAVDVFQNYLNGGWKVESITPAPASIGSQRNDYFAPTVFVVIYKES